MQARTTLLTLLGARRLLNCFNSQNSTKLASEVLLSSYCKTNYVTPLSLFFFSTRTTLKESPGQENKDLASNEENKRVKNDTAKEGEPKTIQEPKKARLKQSPFRNLYAFTLGRVINTCRVYLALDKGQLDRITESSRFYYIHEAFKNFDEEKKKRLLASFDEYYLELYKPRRPKGQEIFETEEVIELTTEFRKSRSSKNYTKKRVITFLSNKEFGALMSNLLMQFLNEDNPDYKFYLHNDSDEKSPGQIVPVVKTIGKISRETLQEHLQEFRHQYSLLLKKL